MTTRALRLPGYSLVELLAVLVIVGILAQGAVPRFAELLFRLEARGTLDRLAADLHHARMLAVRGGVPVEVRLATTRRCIQGYRVRALDQTAPAPLRRLPPAVTRRCPRHTGTGVLTFGPNGVLRPTGLTITVPLDDTRYQVVVSSVGRVLRNY